MYNRQGRKDTGTQIDRKTEKYKERFLDILRILLQACSNIDNVKQKKINNGYFCFTFKLKYVRVILKL